MKTLMETAMTLTNRGLDTLAIYTYTTKCGQVSIEEAAKKYPIIKNIGISNIFKSILEDMPLETITDLYIKGHDAYEVLLIATSVSAQKKAI